MVVSRTRLELLPEDLILYLLMGFEVTSLLKFRQVGPYHYYPLHRSIEDS